MTTNEAGVSAERLLFGALDALRLGDTNPWAEMFHDDGVMEFPYAPPGFPERLNQSHGETRSADAVRLTESEHTARRCDERDARALEAR